MTRQETLALMAILKAAYPAYYRDMTRQDAEAAVALWAEMFADDDPSVVASAVKAFIAKDKRGFPPHIGAIKESVVQVLKPQEMTEQEAWGYVAKAIRNSGYNSEKEFAKMPEIVQRLVGSPAQLKEWALMDAETVSSVVASNFQRSYKARAASERDYIALPADVRRVIAKALPSAPSFDIALAQKMMEENSNGSR